MSDGVQGFVTASVCAVLTAAAGAGVGAALGGVAVGALLGGIAGLLYGLEAGILVCYDLRAARGWAELLVDLTWSLANTVFGLVFGNAIYIFFGNPSRADSRHRGWIVFRPRSAGPTGFGHSVLQTLGTVNIGGPGHHERMHLLQARIFGPAYLPLFALCYIVTFTLQVLWTFTVGGALWLAKIRGKPHFEPPPSSAVGGFFGWIYYATLFELWAYASGNP